MVNHLTGQLYHRFSWGLSATGVYLHMATFEGKSITEIRNNVYFFYPRTLGILLGLTIYIYDNESNDCQQLIWRSPGFSQALRFCGPALLTRKGSIQTTSAKFRVEAATLMPSA